MMGCCPGYRVPVLAAQLSGASLLSENQTYVFKYVHCQDGALQQCNKIERYIEMTLLLRFADLRSTTCLNISGPVSV